MKHGAIFDMDGLLFDTERLYQESWMILAEQFGQTPDPEFPKAVCGSNGDTMRAIIRAYYPNVDADAFMQACLNRVDGILETSVPEKPGIREMLDYLRAHGVKTAVASSSRLELIEHNLALAGIRDRFDALVSGEEVAHGKPAPDIFLLAAERIGCAPEDCYVFEDGANGIRAGAAAGCTTAMVVDLSEPTDELRALCAGIYSGLPEALAAIQNAEI